MNRAIGLQLIGMLMIVFGLSATQAADLNLENCQRQKSYKYEFNFDKDLLPEYQKRVSESKGDKKSFALYLQIMMNLVSERDYDRMQKRAQVLCELVLPSTASNALIESMNYFQSKDLLPEGVTIPQGILDLTLKIRENSLADLKL